MAFELFYASGGHGGPYHTLESAIDSAEKMLVGSPTERAIHVHTRTPVGINGFGQRVATVSITRFGYPALVDGAISVTHHGVIIR